MTLYCFTMPQVLMFKPCKYEVNCNENGQQHASSPTIKRPIEHRAQIHSPNGFQPLLIERESDHHKLKFYYKFFLGVNQTLLKLYK